VVEAVEWLQSFLSEGPVKASEAKRQSKKDGLAEITLKRAKKKLGIETEQKDRCWWWKKPGQSIDSDNNPPSDAEVDDTSPSNVGVGETSFTF